MPRSSARDRYKPTVYENEIERLCAYLKNDSMVKWSCGASQAQIDAARAKLAATRRFGTYTPKPLAHEPEVTHCDEAARRVAAEQSNRRYLAAIRQASR